MIGTKKAPERATLVVLFSGRGSNLQALIDACRDGALPAHIAAAVSDRPDAAGLERARRAGIPTQIVERRAPDDRARFERRLIEVVDRFRPQWVLLAGFMRILGPAVVRHYAGRLINIHPSLLPRFKGLETHRRALEAGASEHGASVHFVDDSVDGGPVILQARVAVQADDTPERLAARVLEQEHRLYPAALRLLLMGRARLVDGRLWIDGRPAAAPPLLEDQSPLSGQGRAANLPGEQRLANHQ